MGKKLYVGNLPYSYTSQQLEELFAIPLRNHRAEQGAAAR